LLRFFLHRLVAALPTILIVVIIGFAVTRLAPGDPITLLAGEQAPPELITELRQKYGLDQSMLVQFWDFCRALLQGDLGFSFANRQEVLTLIAERLPATLLLVLPSIAFAIIAGTGLAVLAVRRLNTSMDSAISALSMVGYSVPVFWLGQLLIFFFAVKLDLFPAGGMLDLRAEYEGFDKYLDVAYHLVLPVLNLGLIYTGLLARLTRAELAETLTLDFITTARAKGLSDTDALFRHALPNSLRPLITMTGILVGLMFAGAIFTETIFSWPGLGRLMFDALFSRDYPIVTAMFLLASISVISVNILVDLIYAAVDPRVRLR
jgi:peptide/nickel transport system permease protein